jgi:broad specificity phosphatase PhoE
VSHSRIVLWRHGRTSWNAQLRWQGQSDIPLDDVGLSQAAEAARKLVEYSPTKIVSSDLMRAERTAQSLADLVGLPVEIDPRLRETNGGKWEGMTQSDIRRDHHDYLESWFVDPDIPAGFDGESRTAVADRMVTAITEHVAATEGTLVVATHGGAARAAIAQLLGLPMDHSGRFKVLSNCGWAVLDIDEYHGTWRVSEYNVTASTPLPESHL